MSYQTPCLGLLCCDEKAVIRMIFFCEVNGFFMTPLNLIPLELVCVILQRENSVPKKAFNIKCISLHYVTPLEFNATKNHDMWQTLLHRLNLFSHVLVSCCRKRMLVPMRQLMLAAVLAVTVVSSDNSCSVISNCQCEHNVKGDLDLWCSHVPQKVVLHAKLVPGKMLSLQCFSMTWMDYELLSGLNVGSTPRVAFTFCPLPNMPLYQMLQSVGASGVESLVFQNSNLSDTLESSFLAGLTNLTTLILHSNEITSLPEEFFQGMTALQYLDMKDNALQLPLHVFDSLSNLHMLELGGNQMTHLMVGIFRNLSRLSRLNLWGNNLQNLTQDVFTGLSSLEFLDLSSNKLTSISADLFAMMPQLKEITMPGNNFTSLPHDLFSSTNNLTKLGLYNNRQQLQHIPPRLLANLTNLLEVYLNMCGITQVPGDIFWGSLAIVNISLHGNLLTTLPAELFRDTANLKNLKLGNNRLQTLPEKIFFGLGKLQVLELDHNQLTNVSG